MTLSRRTLLQGASAFAAFCTPIPARAEPAPASPTTAFTPRPGAWRKFEVTTKLELAGQGAAQAWVPIAGFTGEDWTRPGETTWTVGEGATAKLVRDARSGADMVHVVWPEAAAIRRIEVITRVATRDRAVDLAAPGSAPPLSPEDRKTFTSASERIVLDGIVRETSQTIVAGKASDRDKARAIYAWVVDNTFRNPKTRGCGTGDIATMLETGNLSGKCADLNPLFVGLARAAGLPARDLYGIRVAPSAFGYKSLGANAATITRAQHCRAEIFLDGLGWVPADPADVRKVVLEEPPGNLDLADPKVLAARGALLGSWETNWLAFNDAHDVTLPGSRGPTLPFLMYPQAETDAGRLDPYDPDAFGYVITTREI